MPSGTFFDDHGLPCRPKRQNVDLGDISRQYIFQEPAMSLPLCSHQICLVSAQTLPNYIGATLPDAAPQTVHLVVTERMKERADILENILKIKKCTVQKHFLSNTEPNELFELLCAIEENNTTTFSINVTGGTKLMALTAVDWASESDSKPYAFYVDTENNSILHIGGKWEKFPISKKLKVDEILLAGAGHKILSGDTTPMKKEERPAVQKLLQLFVQDNSALALFNKCASQARFSESNPDMQINYVEYPTSPGKGFVKALALAEELGKVTVHNDGLCYASEQCRFWCNGGWLEEYVKDTLFQLKNRKIIDDFSANVQLDYRTHVKGNDKDAPQNEIDAAFTACNRLFVMECKTSNLNKNGKVDTKAEEAIYKLDSLRKSLGGTFSEGMLVAIHPTRREDQNRCKELGIELVSGSRVLGLASVIEERIRNVAHV